MVRLKILHNEKSMAKKITLDTLAQLVEERAQGIEQKMATKDELRETKELVHEVLALVKNIDEKIGDVMMSWWGLSFGGRARHDTIFGY